LKYPPKHHQEKNFDNIVSVIKKYPFATLISTKNDSIYTTHLPLIYRDNAAHGILTGHIDKHNLHAELLKDDANVTVLFHGPDSYISPTIYSTKQLPTWNYIKVHIEGTVQQITDGNSVKQSIVGMTDFLETQEKKFVLDNNDPRMEALIDYIIGFEITITKWEGKFKLSQDKLKRDMELAKAALIKNQKEDISIFIDEIMNNHQQDS